MALKLNIGDPKSKKTYQLELDDQNSAGLKGKKIGETFKGELIDKPGYEFTITGGSDKAGFPMRNDVEGDRRKKILITYSVGNRKRRRGQRLKRTVAGNMVGDITAQVNVKIAKYGKKPILEETAPEGDAPAEGEAAPAAEAPQEKAKDKPPKEDKPEEKKEAPKEEKKEAPKAEPKAEKPEEKKE